VVGCPIASINAEEILDAYPIVEQATKLLTNNKEFSNLPRKYKISISGCHLQCNQPDINCVGFYAVRDGNEVGFGLKVGGGLSTNPYFGVDMGVFLQPEEVIEVLRAISEIYRDAPQLREGRHRARLKFLVHDPKFGIGGPAFRARIEEKLGRKMRDGGPYPSPRNAETDHIGIQKQKQEGLYFVGIGVRAGRMTGQKLMNIAAVAEEFSTNQTIRNTNKQNFIITNVPEDKLEQLKARLDEFDLDYRPSVFKRALISCTGIEFCNLAVTETKEVGRRVSRDLEERFPNATKNIRIHFSGCPNNCGQNAIADIGLRGGKTKGPDGQMIEAFDILVGGATGEQRAFAEVSTKKYPSDKIADAIGNLYQSYLDWSSNGESFQEFVRAHTKEQLDAIARGLPTPEIATAEAAASA
jgi:sulfite reductase (ferredoxin)